MGSVILFCDVWYNRLISYQNVKLQWLAVPHSKFPAVQLDPKSTRSKIDVARDNCAESRPWHAVPREEEPPSQQESNKKQMVKMDKSYGCRVRKQKKPLSAAPNCGPLHATESSMQNQLDT